MIPVAPARPVSTAARGWLAAATALRLLTAVATAGTGYVHAYLYTDGGYRVIHVVGPGFLLLASGAFAVAVLLAVGDSPVLRLGAAGVAVGGLGGFVLSRTVGVFGFTERGLDPAPEALISLVTEVGALALLLAAELARRRIPAGR